jgi:hypothetical protein
MNTNSVEDERLFLVRRVARPGATITQASVVVACEWTEVKLENVYTFICRSEDLTTVTGCTAHKGCKGHHIMDQNRTAYMIPFGFATGDEQGSVTRPWSTPGLAAGTRPPATSRTTA